MLQQGLDVTGFTAVGWGSSRDGAGDRLESRLFIFVISVSMLANCSGMDCLRSLTASVVSR